MTRSPGPASEAPGDSARRTRRSSGPSRRHIRPWLYVAPAGLILSAFLFLPLVAVAALSLFDWNLLNDSPRFVGIQNYADVLGDDDFLRLAWQTGCYLALAIFGNCVVPIGLALLTLRVGRRASEAYRSLLFVPAVISTTVGAVIWQYLYLPAGGPINELLDRLGVAGPNWLADPATALPAIALIASWNTFGFNYVIALGGLSAIPTSLIEAARLDGASGWRLLTSVTLPLASPTLVFVAGIAVLQALPNAFVVIQLTTGGGPNGATSNLFHGIYVDAFEFFHAGRGAAGAIVLVVLLMTLMAWQHRLVTRRVSYGEN